MQLFRVQDVIRVVGMEDFEKRNSVCCQTSGLHHVEGLSYFEVNRILAI